jgi:ABC-2 type transport system permease protein
MPIVVRKTLREYRRSLIGWTLGLCGFLGMYLSIYASVSDDPETLSAQALAKYPGALKDLMGGLTDIGTGVGYLQTVAYQLLGPMLLIMCAAGLGNRAIAQPEEEGLLELTVTLPLERKRLVLERWLGMAIGLVAIGTVTLAVVLAAANAAGMGVPAGNILAAHTGLILLALLFGTVALTVGAATGRKNIALAVTGVWAVAGYIVETLGRNVEWISWARWLSPFHYFLDGRPLYTGWPVGDYLILLAATAVLVMTAVLAFDRRDVGV